jgi:uncharacterized Tic20 family protein
MNEANSGDASPAGAPAGPSAQERQWAMFAHLSVVLGGLITSGWAGNLGYFIGPLVIWLVKKDTMPFVADQAREALNFAITVSLACLALLILTVLTLGIGLLVTGPLLIAIAVVSLVLVVIAAIKANEGIAYRYPFALRLIK